MKIDFEKKQKDYDGAFQKIQKLEEENEKLRERDIS